MLSLFGKRSEKNRRRLASLKGSRSLEAFLADETQIAVFFCDPLRLTVRAYVIYKSRMCPVNLCIAFFIFKDQRPDSLATGTAVMPLQTVPAEAGLVRAARNANNYEITIHRTSQLGRLCREVLLLQ